MSSTAKNSVLVVTFLRLAGIFLVAAVGGGEVSNSNWHPFSAPASAQEHTGGQGGGQGSHEGGSGGRGGGQGSHSGGSGGQGGGQGSHEGGQESHEGGQRRGQGPKRDKGSGQHSGGMHQGHYSGVHGIGGAVHGSGGTGNTLVEQVFRTTGLASSGGVSDSAQTTDEARSLNRWRNRSRHRFGISISDVPDVPPGDEPPGEVPPPVPPAGDDPAGGGVADATEGRRARAGRCDNFRPGVLDFVRRLSGPNLARLYVVNAYVSPRAPKGKQRATGSPLLNLAYFQAELEKPKPDLLVAGTFLGLAADVPVDKKIASEAAIALCVSAPEGQAGLLADIAEAQRTAMTSERSATSNWVKIVSAPQA